MLSINNLYCIYLILMLKLLTLGDNYEHGTPQLMDLVSASHYTILLQLDHR